MTIEFIIIVSLAIGASIFVVIVATTLIVHKFVSIRVQQRLDRLHGVYSIIFSELILTSLPPLSPGSKTSAIFKQYEELIEPMKVRLAKYSPRRQTLHRKAMREVLVRFARDVIGDPAERLLYFFYSFNFVEDEIGLMNTRHWWVRALAARELGLLKARKAIAPLTAALEDPHPDVRNQAMQSLVAIVGVGALPNILRLSRNLSRWTTVELSVIVKQFESAAVPALLDALDLEDRSIVVFCLEMLAESGFVDAVEKVRHIAQNHPDLHVRSKAIEVLGRLGDERAERLLLQLAESPVEALRLSALFAIERIGMASAVPVLLKRIRQASLAEKIVAARALARSGTIGVEHLRSLLIEESAVIRSVAEQVLEEVESPAIVT